MRERGGRVEVALAREGDFSGYVLPKGGVKKGELLVQAARREIAEEAGLRGLTLVEYLGWRERLNFARTRWMTVHYFLFRWEGEGGVPSDARHPHPAEWFALDALPEMMWPEQAQLLREVVVPAWGNSLLW